MVRKSLAALMLVVAFLTSSGMVFPGVARADVAPTIPGTGLPIPTQRGTGIAALMLSAAAVTAGLIFARRRGHVARIVVGVLCIVVIVSSYRMYVWANYVRESHRGGGRLPYEMQREHPSWTLDASPVETENP